MLDLENVWELRSVSYTVQDLIGKIVIANYLKQINPESLIEIGCGPGCLFKTYRNIPRVVAVDFSEGMLFRAGKRIKNRQYKNIELRLLDITKEAPSEKFDLALTRTCLMHIPPENIEKALKNIAAITNQMLLLEYFSDIPKALQPHNWLHNYPILLQKIGFQLDNFVQLGEETCFFFKKNPEEVNNQK